MVQNFLTSIMGVIGLFFIVRYYPESWGILSFGIGFVGLFTLVSDLGYSNAYTRFLSAGEDEGTVNGTFGIIKLLLGLLFVVVTVAALLIWTDVLHRGFEYSVEYWVVIGLIPYYFFTGLVGFFQSFYRSKYQSARYVIPSIFETLLRNSIFVLMGVAAIFRNSFLSVNNASLILALTYDTSYGLYVLLYYLYGRPWKFSRFNREIFRKFTLLAIPLSIASVVTTVNLNIDKVIIQFYYGAFATGGFYLDQRLANNISNFANILTIFFLPVMARMHANRSSEDINTALNNYERAIVIFVLPFVIGIAFLSADVIRIFNGEFVAYSSVFTLLALSALFGAFANPAKSALIAKNKAHAIGAITVVAVVINIGLNLLLIPPAGRQLVPLPYVSLGPFGAGLASLAANILVYAAFRYFLFRTSGTKFDLRILAPLIAAAFEAAFLFVTLNFISASRIYVLIPVFVVAFVIYVAGLLVTKQVVFSELVGFVRNLLNPFHITNTFKTERDESDSKKYQ